MKPHRGVMILIFGILAIMCCAFFGIASWIMGNADLKEMDAGQMDPTGRSMTQAGKICGIVGLVLTVLGLIGYAVVIAIAVASGAMNH